MHLTDTHTHLYLEQFDEDRERVVDEAINSGIKKMVLPNIDSATIQPMLNLCDQYPQHCFPLIGLHPTSVKENFGEELEIIESYLDKRTFFGIGETGMDLYWDKTLVKEQEMAFRRQINWAKERSKPIIIHSRNAHDEIIKVLKGEGTENLTGVFHCFTGNNEQANEVISMGLFLGIGGVLTFKNSGLDKTIKEISLEHIVLETDSPYLAPVPHRGKRNESAYTKLVAMKLAEIKQVSFKEAAEITTANAEKLFNLGN